MLSLTSKLDNLVVAEMTLRPESLTLTFLWLFARVAMPLSITSSCWCYKKIVILIYMLYSKVMITMNVFDEVSSLDPKDGGSTPLSSSYSKLPHLFKGWWGWGREEISGRKMLFMLLVQFDFLFLSILWTYHSICPNYFKCVPR